MTEKTVIVTLRVDDVERSFELSNPEGWDLVDELTVDAPEARLALVNALRGGVDLAFNG